MTSQTRVLATAAALVVLSTVTSAFADWTAHADFSSCPRGKFSAPTAEEGPFATQAACEARVAEVKRAQTVACVRYSCKEGAGGGGASSAAPGHELDSTIERAISAGISGDISGTEAVGLVGLGVVGNALLGAAASSPEEQQQAEAQRQYQQQQAAEQARQRAVEEEQRKDRLLGEMQGVESTGDLQLMTDDGDVPPPTSGDAGAGGELALMTDDDDTQDIMGKRKAPKPKRNQPPATRVNIGPYTPGAGPKTGGPSANAPVGTQTLAMKSATAEQANAGPTDRESFSKGGEDGGACRQRSAGTHCGVLKGEAVSSCQRSYNLGYDAGAAEQERKLKAQGAAAAAADGKVKGAKNAALNHAEAQGSCGNMFIRAYNEAFRQP